jgi:Flp pilus assembly protein TadB
MEAGMGTAEALFLAAESCAQTSLGEELQEVVAHTRHGQPLHDSLTALRERLRDQNIDEFVLAMATSHQLGARVSQVLLDMARRMRQRRSHEIEAAVGRAQIQLYYPATVLLLVCMVAVAAPFVAPMWGFLQESAQ